MTFVHHGITTKDFFQFLLFVIGCSIATIDLETSCVIESSFGGAILSKIVTIKLTSAQLNNLGEKNVLVPTNHFLCVGEEPGRTFSEKRNKCLFSKLLGP